MLDTTPFRCYNKGIRGISTVGSASHSHCEGQGFDSPMLHQWSIIQTLFTLSAVSLFVLLYNTERKMTDRYSSLRSICPSFLFTFIKNIINFEANSLFFEPHHQRPLMHRSSFSLFQIYHLE